MKRLILTNYINKKSGALRHGSELTHEQKKSGEWHKTKSYNCNQNMPYGKMFNGEMVIFRKVYGKEIVIDIVD